MKINNTPLTIYRHSSYTKLAIRKGVRLMAIYSSLLLLAFAVSIDSFSVGFTYGLRKMRIPFKSILIIACCSGVTLLIAMLIGHLLLTFMPIYIADKLGGIILILIGAWVLLQFFRQEKQESMNEENEKTIFNLEIKSIGVVIHILRKPMRADMDNSGTITGIEAFLLGFALSLDAFGAGIGAALLGYSPISMSILVAVMSSLFVLAGIKSGHLFADNKWMDKFACLPGILLIIIGVWKL